LFGGGGADGVQYAYYFERDCARSHLSLAEWAEAVAAVPGVRPVAGPLDGLGEWLGYYVNPHGMPGGQFHDRPDRAHDAEVYFPAAGRWLRAFYWHARPEPGLGAVTFEGCPASVSPDESPVWVAAHALAARLGAELVGEDDTAYEG
jgi:hypothetical protein